MIDIRGRVKLELIIISDSSTCLYSYSKIYSESHTTPYRQELSASFDFERENMIEEIPCCTECLGLPTALLTNIERSLCCTLAPPAAAAVLQLIPVPNPALVTAAEHLWRLVLDECFQDNS